MNISKTSNSDFLILNKGYFGNGKLLGRLCKSALQRRIRQTSRIQKLQKIPEKEMNARVADFTRLLARVAPQWLEEADGLARGAGSAIKDLLKLNCLPHGFYPSGGGCTSFLEIGRDENRLFKIRDERNHPQVFYIKHLSNGISMQVGHDIGNIGIAHCFTNAPLAGANNTGSHVQAGTDDPLLNDCHVLRFIAERARNTNQIPRLLDKLISQRAIKGAGYDRGAIFLFADAQRGLIIECTGSDFAFRYFDRGTQIRSNHFIFPGAIKWESRPPDINTLRRKQRMEELLKRSHRPPLIEEIFALSRDRKNQPNALCNDDKSHFWMTISAQLQVINRETPSQSVNYICCGNTRCSIYLRIPMLARRSFAPLANGAWYDTANRLYKARFSRSETTRLLQDMENSIIGANAVEPPSATAYRTLIKD